MMNTRTIEITGRYLQIPVRMKQDRKQLHFYCGREKILEMGVPVGDDDWNTEEFDFYGQLPMASYQGKTLQIEGDVPEGLLLQICCSDEKIINEEKRPSYHFTPNVGWMNDPNGLVFADGLYHYYFQHNPLDREWDNMSWGHAVSRDLLHWKELDIVLLPEKDGTIYSGSAIVNKHAALGYPENAILAFYTVAGDNSDWSRNKDYVQKTAVSTDGGNSFTPLKTGVLLTLQHDNRDPKVFWHEESQAYTMILWIEKDIFGIFRSKDLTEWEESQRFVLTEGFECPNLAQVFTEDGQESCWIVIDAAGRCYTGSFDGYRFEWSSRMQRLFGNEMAYAAQIYEGTPGRVILIPWLRTNDTGRKYHSSAGIPRELYLKKEEDGSFFVCQKPIREYEAQKQPAKAENATEMTVLLQAGESVKTTVFTEGQESVLIAYDTEGKLLVEDKKYPVPSGMTKMRVITDDRILEIFLEDASYIALELPAAANGFMEGNLQNTDFYSMK